MRPYSRATLSAGQQALALLDRARTWDVPFRYVTTDAGYGDNPTFVAGLEERKIQYVCAVERSFGVRLPDDVQDAAAAKPEKPQGKGRPKLPRPALLYPVETVVAAQPERAWQTISWREGTKGALQKQVLAIRAHRATGEGSWGKNGQRANPKRVFTGEEGWLLAERPGPRQEGERKYYYANLPADTPLERLVTIAHARWVIEQFYKHAKGECGPDDYQGRRWDGLHRHLALAMLTDSFLMLQRHTASDTLEGGLSPLSTPVVSRRAPAGPHLVTETDRGGQTLMGVEMAVMNQLAFLGSMSATRFSGWALGSPLQARAGRDRVPTVPCTLCLVTRLDRPLVQRRARPAARDHVPAVTALSSSNNSRMSSGKSRWPVSSGQR